MIDKSLYIDFPKEECESYIQRLERHQKIYTTRVSNEVGKYMLNHIYNSPFGNLKVTNLIHLENLEEHPFYNELNESQKNEIRKFVNEKGFDIIELTLTEEDKK